MQKCLSGVMSYYSVLSFSDVQNYFPGGKPKKPNITVSKEDVKIW